MSKTLIVGSNHASTSTFFKKFNLEKSVLVTSVDQDYTVGHTSPQDFETIDLFCATLAQANLVYWGHPLVTEFINKEEYYKLLYLLRNQQINHNNIVNYNTIANDPYNWVSSLPTLTSNDSVFLGCSYTAGDGLLDANSRYSTLVSQAFGTNCINLAKGGGSNARSFDILSQLEFVPGQIVVWQITFLERLRYCDPTGNLKDVMLSDCNIPAARELIEVYNRKFLLNELVTKIRIAIKIARANRLRFVFWLPDYKNDDIFSFEDQMYFYNFPEFIPSSELENFLVDKGTDNLHPGPDSNKLIADAIIKHIKRIYK